MGVVQKLSVHVDDIQVRFSCFIDLISSRAPFLMRSSGCGDHGD